MSQHKKLPTTQPFLLSIAEVAIQLGVCRQTVYNLIYHQGLPTISVGKLRRVDPESLRDWIKAHEQELS
jgi:excisionase family DNA binding protein